MDRRFRAGAGALDLDDAPHPPHAPAPGKRALTDRIARSARGPVATPAPGDAFAHATSGRASSLPMLAQVEAAFGVGLGDVRAHVGTPEARDGLDALGARAAAFGDAVAFADAAPDLHLVAHEVAHVVQHRNSGGGGVQARALDVSQPGEAAEIAADRAADAVVRGLPVPDVGTAGALTLHRAAVTTNGGTFTDSNINLNHTGTLAPLAQGAGLDLDFAPNALVVGPAASVLLVQTVRAHTNQPAAGGAAAQHARRDIVDTDVNGDADSRGMVAGNGSAVDITPHARTTDSNHHPGYGVGANAPDPSTTLAGGTPTLGRTRRGNPTRDAAGTALPALTARMEDGPSRHIDAPGETNEMDFEVTALVTDGPMANTYLGSIGWGWSSNAAGTVTFSSPTIRQLSAGAPTSDFVTAATTWNAASMHQGGATVPTVDLPVATPTPGAAPTTALGSRATARAPSTMSTADLITALSMRTAALPAAGPDHANVLLELRALAQELRGRELSVTAEAVRLQDTGTAARPPEDEVWVSVDSLGATGGTSAATITAQRRTRRGQTQVFHFRAGAFMADDDPTAAPSFPSRLAVRVMDHDRAPRGPGSDDTIAAFDWAAPFTPTSEVGRRYHVSIQFDR